MKARRTDANHKQIMSHFRALGCSVRDTSGVGQGFPDLVVAKHGRNVLVEIKDGSKPPSARKLTPDEQKFHDSWKGRLALVLDLEGAERVAATIAR